MHGCVYAPVGLCPGAHTRVHTCGECAVVSSWARAAQMRRPGGDSGLVLQFHPPAPGSLAEVRALELGSPGAHDDTPDLTPLGGSRWPGLLVNKPQRHLEAPLLGSLEEACAGPLCWRRGWPSSWSWPGCVPGLPLNPETGSGARSGPRRFRQSKSSFTPSLLNVENHVNVELSFIYRDDHVMFLL